MSGSGASEGDLASLYFQTANLLGLPQAVSPCPPPGRPTVPGGIKGDRRLYCGRTWAPDARF